MSLFSKPISSGKEFAISDEEFVQLRDFVYRVSGIYVADNRKYLMENRLVNRLKELNLRSFSEYHYYLQYDSGRREEINRLFEVITTNETSFYRNPPQLSVFQDKVLPETLEALRRQGQKKLRIWSAGCSTGEEPYTLSIIIQEVLGPELDSWDVKITANDLSERVIATARKGIFCEYTLRTTPPEILDRYFDREGKDYKVRSEVKRLVSFGQINLNDRAQLKLLERSDILFCRNVIIYFDEEMKKRVINSFYDNLLPRGYLFIGHSESLHNISRTFKPVHYPGAIVYKKEE